MFQIIVVLAQVYFKHGFDDGVFKTALPMRRMKTSYTASLLPSTFNTRMVLSYYVRDCNGDRSDD